MGCTSSQEIVVDGEKSYNPSSLVMGPGKKGMGCKVAKEDVMRNTGPDCKKREKKILVVMTDKRLLTMANGKIFNTGHNVSETFLPLIHMAKLGYEFDIATAAGKGEVVFEDWSWAGCVGYEKEAKEFRETLPQMKSPMTTAAALQNAQDGAYVALFFPGGHGTMVDMHCPPDEGATGKLLEYFHEKQLTTIVICHGPQSLRAAPKDLYKDYEICCFPDADDVKSPKVGYMPGQMVEFMREELSKHHSGIKFMNQKNDDSVFEYKELVSGASPSAANNLGKLAYKVLLKQAAE